SVIIYDKYVVNGVEYSAELKSAVEDTKSVFGTVIVNGDAINTCLVAAYLCDNVKATDLDYYFYECESLVWVGNLPKNSVTSLNRTFMYCEKMEYYPELPAGVVSMEYTFAGNLKLEKVEGWKFPDSVQSMRSCFYRCGNMVLFDSELPPNLTSIRSLFENCFVMTTCRISIPSKVENICGLFIKNYELTKLMDYKLYHEKGKTNNIIILPKSVKYAEQTFMRANELESKVFFNGPVETLSQMFVYSSIEDAFFYDPNFKIYADYYRMNNSLAYANVSFNPFERALTKEDLQIEDLVR
ncbi:MAG: leucine-rich repeat protein, partial [Lachnospiraceae bacterium]|nr:leucine-rich repeat protein [Lachnospiraceae bacterium]